MTMASPGGAWFAATAMAACLTAAPAWGASAQDEAPRSSGTDTTATDAASQDKQAGTPKSKDSADQAKDRQLTIRQYLVKGNTVLDPAVIGNVVQPYMGPNKHLSDVDKARKALAEAYQERGFRTVGVTIPRQTASNGIVKLEVVEGKVDVLTVSNSRYTSLDRIKAEAPSLAEGTVPDFNKVKDDLRSLNRSQNHSVTPKLTAGNAPGSVDVNLVVDDDFPVSGRAELNNRRSQDTSNLRALGQISYDNLWQLGHSATFTYQVAPQNPDDAEVFFGSYLAPVSDHWSVLFNALASDSDVSTLGGTNVIGRGQVYGLKAIYQLSSSSSSFTSLSASIDYKDYQTNTRFGDNQFAAPITYVPISLGLTRTQYGDYYTFGQNARITFSNLGLGSGADEFDDSRFNARNQQYYLRGGLSWDQVLPKSFKASFTTNGQITDQPLVTYEQFSAGGMDSVRGYLEAEQTGDDAIAGTAQFNTPSFDYNNWVNKLTAFAFFDFARLWVVDALPDQEDRYFLASTGAGLDLSLVSHLNGRVEWAVPLEDSFRTEAHDDRVLFRVWAEF